MPNYVTVYHGTSHGFEVEIEDHGLRVRPGLSKGTRVCLRRELALVHAMGWSAYIMLTQQLPPIGLIASATIEKNRVREGVEKNPLADMPGLPGMERVIGPSLVVPGGIRPEEIKLEQVKLPMLYDPAVAKKAIEVWERLTDRTVSLVPGSTGE